MSNDLRLLTIFIWESHIISNIAISSRCLSQRWYGWRWYGTVSMGMKSWRTLSFDTPQLFTLFCEKCREVARGLKGSITSPNLIVVEMLLAAKSDLASATTARAQDRFTTGLLDGRVLAYLVPTRPMHPRRANNGAVGDVRCTGCFISL